MTVASRLFIPGVRKHTASVLPCPSLARSCRQHLSLVRSPPPPLPHSFSLSRLVRAVLSDQSLLVNIFNVFIHSFIQRVELGTMHMPSWKRHQTRDAVVHREKEGILIVRCCKISLLLMPDLIVQYLSQVPSQPLPPVPYELQGHVRAACP